ncbi:MAG: hypothetical protein HY303_20130 [Candidatus Wallbacteria bacterium]|nr:hypothetical protein [Candidatus Wallbacteria bacterium]
MKTETRLVLFLLALLALGAPSAFAGSPLSVSATAGRTSATLGDMLEFTITVSAPPGAVTSLSGVATALATAGLERSATLPGSLLGMESTAPTTATTLGAPSEPKPDVERTTRTGDFDITVRSWKVAAFKLGSVEISGAKLRFRMPGGQEGEQLVPTVPLQVVPVTLPGNLKPEDGKTFGVKPPVAILAPPERRWALAALILILGIVVSLLIWKPELLARLLARAAALPAPPKPAHTLALEALDRLVSEGLLDRGMAREHFGRLSDILRTYLDSRFGLRSMEATTDELTPILRRHEVLGKQWLEPLRRFLATCDLAKFARHVPPRPIPDELAGFARKLVRETMPEDEPALASSQPQALPPASQEVNPS